MKKLILLLFYSFTLALFNPSPASANHTALHTTATGMAPGTWNQVTGTNAGLLSTQFYQAGSRGNGYNDNGLFWDSTSHKILHMTSEHGPYVNCPDNSGNFPYPQYPGGCWKPLAFYDDATNTWSINATGSVYMPDPFVLGAQGHNNDEVAWDDVNKVLYIKAFDRSSFWRWCVNNSPSWCVGKQNTWTQLPMNGPMAGSVSIASLVYHPTMNAGTGGTLVVYQGDQAGFGAGCGALYAFRESTATWTHLDDGRSLGGGSNCKFNAGDYNTVAEYSPVKQVTIFGGGNGSSLPDVNTRAKRLWKIDNNGTITALAPAPWPIGFANVDTRQAIVDPVSGDFIFLFGHSNNPGVTTDNAELWRLNPDGGGTWTLLDGNLTASGKPCAIGVIQKPCPNDFYSVAISTYGVLMYWKMTGDAAAEVWLYKVSASNPDIVAPTVSITAPAPNATVSGSSVTLSANAADAVGVVGVQFKVDGVAVNAEDIAAPYSTSWNSTTVSNGTHSITATARDAASNITTSTPVSVTVANAAGGASDFATRCNAASAVGGRCIPFDNASEITANAWGSNTGVDSGFNDGKPGPIIDTAIKASGNGSIKFTISSQSPANGASTFWMNFSTDLSKRYGAGESFYLQWRQRFSPEFLNTIYTRIDAPGVPAGGWKTSIITTGDHTGACTAAEIAEGCQNQQGVASFPSCTNIDIPTQNTNQIGFIRAYNSCTGSSSHGAYWDFTRDIPSNLANGGCSSDCYLQDARPAPYCLYSQQPAPHPANGKGLFPPNGNCFGFFANEWMTFKVKITLGPRGSNGVVGASPNDEWVNSNFKMWVGREGQPLQPVMDFGPYNSSAGIGDQKLGKIYIGPYHSFKDPTQVHATAYTWYDELIFSPQDIADPGATPDTTNPTVAITNPIPPTASTTTSPIAVSGTAADNIGVTAVTWTCIQCVTKGGTATSSPGMSISWLIPALDLAAGVNTVNVVAHDAAGNVSTAASITITLTSADRFASVSGVGASPCIISAPCSLTTAIAITSAGDRLNLRAGTYTTRIDSTTLTINSGTSFSNAVTIRSYDGALAAIIQPAGNLSAVNLADAQANHHIIFDGLSFDCTNVTGSGTSCVSVGSTAAVHHIRFINTEFKNTGASGLLTADIGAGALVGGSDNEFTNCSSHHNGFNSTSVGGSHAPYGFYIAGPRNVIDNCQIHHNGGFGVHAYRESGSGNDDNTVRNSTVYENGEVSSQTVQGILMTSGFRNAAYNNVVWTTYSGGHIAGISMGSDFRTCHNCVAYSNTVVGFQGGGLLFPANVDQDGGIARNNILINNAGDGNLLVSGTGSTSSNNLCSSACGFGTSNQIGSALTTFVSAVGHDYRLLSSSLAKDTGTPLTGNAAYAKDLTGLLRPQGIGWDMGAYELVASVAPVVTIVNPTSNTTIGVTSPIFSLGGTSSLP